MSGWDAWLDQFQGPAHYAAIIDQGSGATCCQKNLGVIDPTQVKPLIGDLQQGKLDNVQANGITFGDKKFAYVRELPSSHDDGRLLVFKGKGSEKGTLAVKLSNQMLVIAGGLSAGQDDGTFIVNTVENTVKNLKDRNN